MEEDRKIKLIWDFHGPEAERTAKHHAIHLKDYIDAANLNLRISGFEKLDKMHAIAFLVVHENKLQAIRDVLKPHRGRIYKE